MARPSQLFDVFISHAGEDKSTIALPMRTMLEELGIKAFVDESDIARGSNAVESMTSAMNTVKVAVIILSPEFVAKKWPMRELLFFLERQELECATQSQCLMVIPVFYRLTVDDLFHEPRLSRKTADGKSLYRKTRFLERMDNGEPEADVDIIRGALRALHEFMGVENKFNASNDKSAEPYRHLLLRTVCDAVLRGLKDRRIAIAPKSSHKLNEFRRYHYEAQLADVFLNFNDTDERDERITYESRIKQHILNYERNSKRSNTVAIVGGGGVGKSTILKGLANEKDLRQRFCDGVHLISMGMDATVTHLFRQLCQVLRDSGAFSIVERHWKEKNGDPPIDELIHDVISWFRGKKWAILIDDVWTNNIDMKVIQSLLNLSCADQRSAVVLTTREHEIAAMAHKMEHMRAREVLGQESRRILFFHSSFMKNDSNFQSSETDNSIVEALKICSGLPLALAVAGKSVKMMAIERKPDISAVWSDYVAHLRKFPVQLLLREVGDYGNLYKTLGVSIDLLDKRRERLGFRTNLSFAEMHRRLCVMKKQSKVPVSMLRHVWKLESEENATFVARLFAEVGLANVSFNFYSRYKNSECSRRVCSLALHDSLHDYAVEEAERNGEDVTAHKDLLKGYARPLPRRFSIHGVRRKWWSKRLNDDGYIHKNLLFHLTAAGRNREMTALNGTAKWKTRCCSVIRPSTCSFSSIALAVIFSNRLKRN